MAELSGFEVLGLLKEIGSALRGAYINSIYRVGTSQLFRFREPGSEDIWLVVSPKKGVWVSRKVAERGDTTGFTTRLRSELERARFRGARQMDLDRIFELDFEGVEERKLIVELMPPGNIVVTDGGGRVLLALNEVRSPSRRVVRGATYQPPAQTRLSPLQVDPSAVRGMMTEEKTVGSAIGKHIALPRKYVSECISRLGLEDASPSSSLEGMESRVAGILAEMVKEARDRPRPSICDSPRGDDIFIIPPTGAKVKRSAETLSELCDELLLEEAQAEPAAQSPAESKRKETLITVSRLRSESAALLSEAEKARADAQRARASTEEDAAQILRASGMKHPRTSASPGSVASLLFDHAKRLESKSEVALETAERLEKRASKAEPEAPRSLKALPARRQEWFEKFRWFFTSEGKLALGGRDAQSNSILITRHLEDGDTVYHADLFGSPFFVLKGGAAQSEEEVRQVARGTVAFSSAWKTGLGAADAYWVGKDQVKTAAPSGEYLQRGSFAISGKKNFVTKNLVEIAVGVDHAGRVVAGPEEAIRVNSARYLVLRPQREKGSDTAKRVLRDLVAEGGVPGPSLDEVLRALPPGGGKILRREKGDPAGQPT